MTTVGTATITVLRLRLKYYKYNLIADRLFSHQRIVRNTPRIISFKESITFMLSRRMKAAQQAVNLPFYGWGHRWRRS